MPLTHCVRRGPLTAGTYYAIGDDAVASNPATTVSNVLSSPAVSTLSAAALTYHGYKRTGSILWALVYGAIGKWKPVIAVPIALAQGFGQRKPCP